MRRVDQSMKDEVLAIAIELESWADSARAAAESHRQRVAGYEADAEAFAKRAAEYRRLAELA